MSAVLEVRDVSVSYGRIRAVQGVSLVVQPGEVVAVLGGNGSGKSTLLRAVAGVHHPETGRIVFLGEDVTRWSAHRIARRGLRLVPEGRGMLGRMSVQENLAMGGYVREPEAADVARVFTRFPVLRERRRQLASTLSGGEQQMLAIARALLAHPALLVLDEPSLGLAPLVVREIFRVIAELRAEGVTILLVEQNARQALQVADRAVILETGRVVADGPAAELARGEAVQRAYLGGVAP